MDLTLYNTFSRQKEVFTPIDEGNVRMYVCGPTVYDLAHIGNARPVIVFDVLFRLLRHLYGAEHVTYVRNITDVDDKIIAAHVETGEAIDAITKRTADAFHADVAALGALAPSEEPRATAHIAEMITLVETLIAKGHAYEADGHVLFSIQSMESYGGLSRHNRDELVAGARVEVAPYKKDPADFVLWKPSAADQPGWDSPWGRGRPGWHLECSAMSEKYLGETFDIHGGGQDLIFPHHENEIAQSTCANGPGTFARYWVHNGYLMVEGEKMSKSLGNFVTVHDLLKEHHGETIRLAMLKTHYRQPIDWTADGLAQAKNELDGFYGALRGAGAQIESGAGEAPAGMLDALADDLNTPQALAALHETGAAADLVAGGALLGLLQLDPEEWFKWAPEGAGGLADADIDALIEERMAARAAKDFARADEIRDQLAAEGVVLEDAAGGTTWKRG